MREALLKLNIGVLSQRIGELINTYHWPIKSEMVRTENGAHVARYSL